eukprot:scaffold239438_cov12-Tisochrysis_lutea.AAC.1
MAGQPQAQQQLALPQLPLPLLLPHLQLQTKAALQRVVVPSMKAPLRLLAERLPGGPDRMALIVVVVVV